MNRLLILLILPFLSLAQGPTYSEHIAPITYNKCLKCHHSNGVAPLTLETYAHVVSNAGMIQHAVATGEMPPWPPDTAYQEYSFENVLNTDEVALITDWISNGSPLGDTLLLPDMPDFSTTSQLGFPDLEIQMPIYSSTAAVNSDDYVCFSIPTGLSQDRRIRAIEVIPGNVEIVHHVLVSIDELPNNSVITTADCMGPVGGLIYSYAPGSPPLLYPSNPTNSFGVVIPAQSSITLSMHYPEGSFGKIDSTKVRFYYYPENTIVREISNEFLINEGLFGTPFYLPPNQITEITGSFGPTPEDYSLMSVFPHMHLLGKDLVCYAVTPSNDTVNLIKIDNWDFEWQGDYYFEKFLKIPAGSMIYAKGNYDNTVSPTNPNPVMVQSGFNTEDEMFVFTFQFLPYQIGDENIVVDSTITSTEINDNIIHSSNRISSIVDLLGRDLPYPIPNRPYFIIYDDGKIERRIIID